MLEVFWDTNPYSNFHKTFGRFQGGYTGYKVGPVPVISRVITPLIGDITPVTQL